MNTKYFNTKHICYLLTILLIVSCKTKDNNNTYSNSNLKYAKGFTYSKHLKHISIKVLRPFKGSKTIHEYIIITGDTIIKPTHKNQIIVKSPIQKIVASSTTQIPILESLNSEKLLKGYPNTQLISSNKTRALINNGSIIELGHEENINTELVLNIKPDVVFAFAVNNLNKNHITLKKAGIPIVIDASWLEETPLGRAEWIKFFGLFLNKEKEANKVFKSIEKNYNIAIKTVSKTQKRPSILYGSIYNGIWYAPAGNSYISKIMKDAKTNYIWQHTKGTGSLSLQFENAFIDGKNSEYWFAPGYAKNKTDLSNKNKHYKQFTPYKANTIYTYTNTVGPTGGLLFFELGALRPDLILSDIVKICHPQFLPNYKTTFFKRLE